MLQKRYVVGTEPVIIAFDNSKRSAIVISMLPTVVESGNIGRVHIGKGYPPSNVLGAPNQGDVLTQGSQIIEQGQYEGDPTVFKGQWWAIASQDNQVILVDES